jgi:1-phosphofructokinase family hexose kinase
MTSGDIITITLNPAVDRVIRVDNLTPGRHLQGRTQARNPGGKGVNVSRVLAGLGVASLATGFLGQTAASVFDPLFAEGLVRNEFVPIHEPTRENITLVDPVAGQDTHIRDVGPMIRRDEVMEFEHHLLQLARHARIVIFSGSLPPGYPLDALRTLLEKLSARNVRVVLDTSGPTLHALADLPFWLLKPNEAELEDLLGRSLKTSEERFAATRALTDRVEMVLLSRGAEGAMLATRQEVLHASSAEAPGPIRNTVGCGDVLLGVFVAGLMRGASRRDALCDAVAAASAAAVDESPACYDPTVHATLRDGMIVRKE